MGSLTVDLGNRGNGRVIFEQKKLGKNLLLADQIANLRFCEWVV